jgi:hypothetical protein
MTDAQQGLIFATLICLGIAVLLQGLVTRDTLRRLARLEKELEP